MNLSVLPGKTAASPSKPSDKPKRSVNTFDSKTAFDYVYASTFSSLQRFINTKIGTISSKGFDTDDITQEVYHRVFLVLESNGEASKTFKQAVCTKQDRQIQAYCNTIAKNLMIDQARNKKPISNLSAVSGSYNERCRKGSRDVDISDARGELQEICARRLPKLGASRKFLEAIVKNHNDNAQIANELGLTVSAVAARKNRLFTFIREQLPPN